VALAKAGALGVISESTENRDLVDERGWVNSFGDNGWSFTKGSAPLVCFSITPRGSQTLRSLLQKGPVKVRANVDSRYYSSVYPYVTGVIRGTGGPNAEEVLSLGHLYEQGAHDNATGFSSILGAAETLNRLIQQGKLSRPQRNIRILGMGECYGTIYYLEHNKDRVRRTVAAMCIDAPAGLQNLAGTENTWVMNPHSASSYVDAFVLRLAQEYYPTVGRTFGFSEHRSGTDNYLGDPTIGIPTVTAVTEKILDRIAIAANADALGRLLYQSGQEVDYTLERETTAVRSAFDLKEDIADLSAFATRQKSRLEREVQDRASALGAGHIQALVPPRNSEAEKIVVRRKRISTITLDDLAPDQREGYPAAGFFGVPVSALYWCDGKRNLAEVIRLTELEMGPQQFDFVGYFKFLQKHGYVDFVQQ
jgi:hypothetical protein